MFIQSHQTRNPAKKDHLAGPASYGFARRGLTLLQEPLMVSVVLEIMFWLAKPVPCAREDELRVGSLSASSVKYKLELELSLQLQSSHKQKTCSLRISEDWVSPAY